MTNTKISFDTPGTIITIIIFGMIGYFVYDNSIDAAISVMLLSFVVGLVTLLSLIPIIGWLISIPLSYYLVIPAMLEMTGIEYTWLITVIFTLNVLLGLLITAFTTVMAIEFLKWR
jgi:hypothetical protein